MYPADHPGFCNSASIQPWMLITLGRAGLYHGLVLWYIPCAQRAVLCLQRCRAPQSVVLTVGSADRFPFRRTPAHGTCSSKCGWLTNNGCCTSL